MATRERKTKVEWDLETGAINLTLLASGEVISLNVVGLSDEIKRDGLFHGLEQKLIDAAAGKDGDEAFESIMAVKERLEAGEWTKAREGAGPQPTLVAEAVMRFADSVGKAYVRADVIAKYTGKEAADLRKAALQNPAVRIAYDEIRAEQAAKRLAAQKEKLAKAPVEASADDLV